MEVPPMIADVEMPDGAWRRVEMGAPVCGEDFCDGCGDCLACQSHDFAEYCNAGASRWVIYKDGPKQAEAQRRTEAEDA